MQPQKTKLTSAVTAHPVLCFFLFAFLISWTAWFLAPTLSGGDAALANLIDLIAAYGPALSAVTVSARLNPEPSGASPKKRIYTFAAVFALIYIIEFAALLIGNTLTLETALTGALSVVIASSLSHAFTTQKQASPTSCLGSSRYHLEMSGFGLLFRCRFCGNSQGFL